MQNFDWEAKQIPTTASKVAEQQLCDNGLNWLWLTNKSILASIEWSVYTNTNTNTNRSSSLTILTFSQPSGGSRVKNLFILGLEL